ncbi:V4R domain-containing protein [Desulfofundulus salinus]|uniref:4-vinyl reductase n=1 Tax=Desulfofundulus salinus TaxID=2419843 RepID=A0A494WTG3_9FIRM|nr:V4R domain-containing protein [Desulfofundulus salinum]RKO66679.1 4-vinyl reductase [Desulfofundulus salinum]
MSQNFAIKVIGYMYSSIMETMDRLPFSGRYWMEEIVQGTALHVLNEHGNELEITSDEPVDICTSYLKLLENKGFLQASDYHLQQEGKEIHVQVNFSRCVYRDFCVHAQHKEFPMYCIRMNALRGVLKSFLHLDYTYSIEVAQQENICRGRLFPSPLPRSEIVIREGHMLKIAGERAMLMPMATYASILASIREHAPHVLVHVLYDAGFRSGLRLARRARKMYPEALECLNILLDELKQHGLGHMELISLEADAGKAVIRCHDSFQVDSISKYGELYRTPRVVCDLLRGTFAACLTELLQREIFCEEVQCQSMGYPCCEFLTLPVEPQLMSRGEGV